MKRGVTDAFIRKHDKAFYGGFDKGNGMKICCDVNLFVGGVKSSLAPFILPGLAGYGTVYDLHQALVRDSSGALKGLVTQFTQATSIAERETLMQSILYQWTAVQNVDPASRAAKTYYGNVIGDARKLEAFMGEKLKIAA